jgi:glucose/arabinose dehydrogenase/mono/diheme cytochrome c family protein
MALFALADVRAVEVPDGFSVETLATNLNAAAAFAVAPDGRVFIADQTGPLRLWKNGSMRPIPALDLSDRLDTYWERGLIGVALHPDFPHTPHLYVMYVAKSPFPHHVVSRFTMVGDRADPSSEQVLLEGDDQTKIGGKIPWGHQGGPICFGSDGKLYLGIGEQTARTPAQSLESLQGKILRLNPDGTIPGDNPFFAQTSGKYRSIWALGLRNPYGLAVEPGTGRLFETDVGDAAFEEVNEIVPGANYGWPHVEGYSTDPRFKSPLYAYPHAIGRCVVGGAFCPATGAGLFPEIWRAKFFFADWSDNWMKALDPTAPANAATFSKGFNAPVAMQFTNDGSLLVLNRGTIWRDGKKWQPNTGSLVLIRFGSSPPETKLASTSHRPLPRTISAAEVLETNVPFVPRDGFVPFQIALPPWQPGVTASRWISLPRGEKLGVDMEGQFIFPKGTTVVQHFTVEKTGAPFETHVLWFTGPRTARAAAYRWSNDSKDAALVEDGEILPLPGDAKRSWFSPGAEQDLNLDLVVVGFVLTLNPRQLNCHGQLQQWSDRGWFDASSAAKLSDVPQLAALDDSTASLELRVRSYLDVNCAACHRPGGPSRGNFDARLTTPLSAQKLVNGELIAGDLAIPGARIIVPGHPEKSVLLQRLLRDDVVRMPPVNVNHEPQPVAPLVEEWIRSLLR